MIILIDTQVLIWYVTSSDSISNRAKRLIDKQKKDGLIYVSSISIWEIALLTQKGRLNLSTDVDSWVKKVEALTFLRFIPVDNEIALKSVTLPGNLHSDPADRIIIATANLLGATLITSDQKIRKYKLVKTSW